MPDKNKFAGVILFLSLFLLIGGIMLELTSFLSFSRVRAQIDPLAFDGSADFYTKSLHHSVLFRARTIGVVFFLSGVFCYVFRRKFEKQLQSFFVDLSALRNSSSNFLRMQYKKVTKLELTAVLFVIAFALVIRLFFLNQPIFYDEAYSYLNYASKPIYITVSWYNKPNQHLFNSVLMKLSAGLFGNEPWALRIPVFLCGIFSIPAIYLVTSYWFRKRIALMTVAFCSVSFYLVKYSTFARGYLIQLLIFQCLLLLSFYLRKHDNLAGWYLFALLSAIGAWTIPIMLYPFGFLLTWLFVSSLAGDTFLGPYNMTKRLLLTGTVTGIITFIFYSPVFVVSGIRSLVANDFTKPLPFSEFLLKISISFRGLYRVVFNEGFPLVLTVVLLLGFVSLVFRWQSINRFKVPLVTGFLFVLILLLIQRADPPSRTWTFLIPLLYAYSAAGIVSFLDYLNIPYREWLIIFLAIGSMAWIGIKSMANRTVTVNNLRYQTKSVLEFIKKRLDSKDDIGFSWSYIPSTHYYARKMNFQNKFINSEWKTQEDLFVVLGEGLEPDVGTNQTRWNKLLSSKKMDPNQFGQPELLKTFRYSKVYQLEKK